MPDPSSAHKDTIILGIDPGTAVTGYAVIKMCSGQPVVLDFGCIRLPSSMKLSQRCLIISDSIEELLKRFSVHEVAVEMQYMNKNPQSTITLGIIRGIVMVAARRQQLPVFAYAPARAKKAVTGNGNASKEQIQRMIQARLNLASPPKPADAADALALAFCHAQASGSPLSRKNEI